MKFWFIICIFGILQTVHPEEHTFDARIGKLCVRLASYRESRRVPYFETYKQHLTSIFHTNQERWNYKTEFYPILRKEPVCCPGYRETNNSMCEPICEPACGNGTCLGPHTCDCDVGYNLEYNLNYNFACIPVCTHDCIHGKCTAPEVCTCDHGYSLSNNSTSICTPICSPPCEKGLHCLKPDHCACLPGYDEITITRVHVTYENRTIKLCKPMCKSKCVNGECDNYNTCVCHDGYEPDPDNLFICKPKCKNGCNFGMCTAPNVCICDNGYTNTSGVCQPICLESCVNGICVAPDTCKCLYGYGLKENSKYICEPICYSLCINGKCTAPNNCTCYEGYVKHSYVNNICKPHCDIPCKSNTWCSSPNNCTCDIGYKSSNKTQTKEIVGKNTSAPSLLCEPICEPKCINGFCRAPYTCECNVGYQIKNTWKYPRLGENNNCEPICYPSCIGSTCVEPNVCKCNSNYRPSDHAANVCDPICHPACETNEICSEPGLCICKRNYRMVHDFQKQKGFKCLPICNVHCSNGMCIEPDVCECFPGYKNAKGGECEPVCEMCNNGTCVAPEVCKCNHGWTGVHCDQHAICILILNNDENRPQTLKIIETQNATIKHILTNNPTCPECINKLNNETLCFKIYTNDMKDVARIGCLMDRECSELWSQYRDQLIIMKPIIILILMLGALGTYYILLRKYRNYRLQHLGARDIQTTSMQGLIEDES